MYRLSGEVEFAFWSRTLSRNCTTFGPASSMRRGSRYISETRNGLAIAAEFNMLCTLVTNFRVPVSRPNRPERSIGEHQGVIVIMGNRQVPCAHRDLQRIDLCAGRHIDTRPNGRGGPNSDTQIPSDILALARDPHHDARRPSSSH